MSLSFVIIPSNEALPLESHTLKFSKDDNLDALLEQHAEHRLGESTKLAPLLLPGANDTAGLYAYSTVSMDGATLSENIRATRLAMACGNLATRFFGDVLLFRSRGGRGWVDLTVNEIDGAACNSPDLRREIQEILRNEEQTTTGLAIIPDWLSNAAQQNYHDNATIARLASVMNGAMLDNDDDESDETSEDELSSSAIEEPAIVQGNTTRESVQEGDEGESKKHFVARSSLCLHCRGPSASLCANCQGAYFCDEPRQCRKNGWSHKCLCSTWKVYTERRAQLSAFPFEDWHLALLDRDCQVSDAPYQQFLTDRLGLSLDLSSWWRTEIDGWAGGDSRSAQTVDPSIRRTFLQGFSPVTDIPPDRRVSSNDIASMSVVAKNSCGLTELSSWEGYYALRKIPLSSPVALLLTFPLTIYFAILKFGEVPVTVARMLQRPLRIHLVGIEKEMNFLDIFREIGYLLPEDLSVELTFVVRRDMLPPKSREHGPTDSHFLKLEVTSNLTLHLVSGTYGDDLDPNFDCGSGPPDMIVGLNAGLFAYDSWRSVISYLYHHDGVVGVFTDYNEHSGMNCASLGGAKSRDSLCVNPFRQPRTMPVLSMNLPQFSNGFMYAYNVQELE